MLAITTALYAGCWTYSHHCHIPDKNPSKRWRWNGEFPGFRVVYVLDGFLRDFLLWVFMCSINFSFFFWASFPATTPRATTPQRSLFRLPHRGLPRPYRYIQANGLPRLQCYYTRATTLPNKLLGTGGLSHLRVVSSYFSFHRLIRQ